MAQKASENPPQRESLPKCSESGPGLDFFVPLCLGGSKDDFSDTLSGIMENVNAQLAAKKSREAIISVGGTLLLIGTWCLSFMYLLGLGEGLWRCVWPVSQTGSKTLSDFLESALNSILPTVIIIVVSVGLFVVGTMRKATPYLPLLSAALNFAFMVSDLVLGNIAYNINLALLPHPLPVGTLICHYTWPHIPVTAILLIALFVAQFKLAIRKS